MIEKSSPVGVQCKMHGCVVTSSHRHPIVSVQKRKQAIALLVAFSAQLDFTLAKFSHRKCEMLHRSKKGINKNNKIESLNKVNNAKLNLLREISVEEHVAMQAPF